MQPLSLVLPKPVLPLPNGPVINSALRLACDNADSVVVNSHHLATLLEDQISPLDARFGDIVFSRESDLMDTAGGIALARERGLLGSSGPVMVLNGDCVLNIELDELVCHHHRSENLVTLALLPHLDPIRWSRVVLDESGRVAAIRPAGQPRANEAPFLYTGAMIVSRQALDALPAEPCGIWERLWHPAMQQRRLGGVVVTGYWREVGTPKAYLETVIDQLQGEPRIDPTAEVAPSAVLGTTLVGAEASIARNAVVAEAIVSHGARIERSARVIRSILLGPVSVGRGETVVNDIRTASLSG